MAKQSEGSHSSYSSPEISTDSNQGGAARTSLFSKIKSAFKSPAAERSKAIMDSRPPRRDSDEWSYMTDPEDETRQIKKRKKKMVTYKPISITQGSFASQGAVPSGL